MIYFRLLPSMTLVSRHWQESRFRRSMTLRRAKLQPDLYLEFAVFDTRELVARPDAKCLVDSDPDSDQVPATIESLISWGCRVRPVLIRTVSVVLDRVDILTEGPVIGHVQIPRENSEEAALYAQGALRGLVSGHEKLPIGGHESAP